MNQCTWWMCGFGGRFVIKGSRVRFLLGSIQCRCSESEQNNRSCLLLLTPYLEMISIWGKIMKYHHQFTLTRDLCFTNLPRNITLIVTRVNHHNWSNSLLILLDNVMHSFGLIWLNFIFGKNSDSYLLRTEGVAAICCRDYRPGVSRIEKD